MPSMLKNSNVFSKRPTLVALPDGKDCRALDAGIERQVRLLADHGVETFESCEGGTGHSFPEPTIRFHGGKAEGFRALAVAMEHGLRVRALHRTYDVIDGEPTGPYWELILYG
jgi:hypothetical protein